MNYETKTHHHRTQNTQHVHTSHSPLHSSHSPLHSSPLHSSHSSIVQVPMPVMASVSGGARAELPQLLKGELVWRSAEWSTDGTHVAVLQNKTFILELLMFYVTFFSILLLYQHYSLFLLYIAIPIFFASSFLRRESIWKSIKFRWPHETR